MMDTLFNGDAVWFTAPAIVATIFFLLKLVFMVAGGGLDAEMDAGGVDFDADVAIDADSAEAASDANLRVLSVQVIAAAIMGFGWGGFSALKGFGMGFGESILIGLGCGLLFGWVQIWLMKLLYSISESGNISVRDVLGREAEVYLTIPPGKQGRGRIRVTVNDRHRMYNAITSDTEPIATKRRVRILHASDDNTVTVEAI